LPEFVSRKMSTVYLYGAIADRFGEVHSFEVTSPAEAIRALGTNFPDFYGTIREGRFRVVRGDLDEGIDLGEEDLTFNLGSADLHIMPVVAGAGNNAGAAKIVIGIALIAVAIYAAPVAAAGAGTFGANMGATAFTVLGSTVTYGNIAMLGATMVLGGIAQMMAPAPKRGSLESAERRPSHIFSGPVNLSEQGNPVPLVYGRVRTGSVVVSAGLETEQIAI